MFTPPQMASQPLSVRWDFREGRLEGPSGFRYNLPPLPGACLLSVSPCWVPPTLPLLLLALDLVAMSL